MRPEIKAFSEQAEDLLGRFQPSDPKVWRLAEDAHRLGEFRRDAAAAVSASMPTEYFHHGIGGNGGGEWRPVDPEAWLWGLAVHLWEKPRREAVSEQMLASPAGEVP